MSSRTSPCPAAISLISPQDALGVARLTYSVYGDQHPFDYVYDPSEIARLSASGTQYAVVAKSSQGNERHLPLLALAASV
jgi:hypothetical protein